MQNFPPAAVKSDSLIKALQYAFPVPEAKGISPDVTEKASENKSNNAYLIGVLVIGVIACVLLFWPKDEKPSSKEEENK